MNKIFCLISILMIALLMTGCGKEATPIKTGPLVGPDGQTTEPAQAPTPADVPPTAPAQPAVTTKVDTLPTKQDIPETVRVEQSAQMSPILKDLLGKADYKTKSYQYLLTEPPMNRALNTYYVKEDKIKIKIFEENAYKLGEYYDTVYLDRANHRATARCENDRRCVTGGQDYTKQVFEADYNKFNTKTPMEWLKEITYAEIIGPEVVDGKSVTKIKSVQNGKTTELWIHNTYGLPLQVQVTHQDGTTEKYQFMDTVFNQVTDSDVMPLFETARY